MSEKQTDEQRRFELWWSNEVDDLDSRRDVALMAWAAAKKAEREAMVKWLRALHSTEQHRALIDAEHFANCLENGDHEAAP